MKFSMPNIDKFDRGTIGRLMKAVRDSVEKWDLDDGWETATGSKKHRLGVVPGWVIIQASDDPSAGYVQIHPDSVTLTEITYTTALAQVRVLAEK